MQLFVEHENVYEHFFHWLDLCTRLCLPMKHSWQNKSDEMVCKTDIYQVFVLHNIFKESWSISPCSLSWSRKWKSLITVIIKPHHVKHILQPHLVVDPLKLHQCGSYVLCCCCWVFFYVQPSHVHFQGIFIVALRGFDCLCHCSCTWINYADKMEEIFEIEYLLWKYFL